MKIRNGFVSNSSSSSFLIYGIYLDTATKEKMTALLGTEKGKYELEDEYCSLPGKEMLETYYPPSGTYIGCSWDSMGNDETKRQFMERIDNALKDIADPTEISSHEESWFDG